MSFFISGNISVADINGKSAYEIAVEHGFEGTEEEWLKSLKGKNNSDVEEQYNEIISRLNVLEGILIENKSQ